MRDWEEESFHGEKRGKNEVAVGRGPVECEKTNI